MIQVMIRDMLKVVSRAKDRPVAMVTGNRLVPVRIDDRDRGEARIHP